MPLISSYQIRCQFLVLVQKHTTSNPLTQFALSNLVTHIFTVDMFPYKITQPLQSSVQSLNFQKKLGNMLLSGFYISFLPSRHTVSTCPVLGNISTQQHFSTLYPLSCRVTRSLASEVGLHDIYTILSTP